ncbi:MAG: LacI family transcriptional regulator [Actinobacteria bacterium]|nr:LacI family transcriptional regulator [Actinomycetota bacterium]
MKEATTLKDIAKKLGVSITTVSKAISNHPDISEKRKEQVLEAIKDMKYVPNIIAKNLREKSTKFIGLIISDNTNPYYARLIKGAEEEIANRNYHTIIFNTDENSDKEVSIINDLISLNVAGVIITPARGNGRSIKILRDYNIPFVLANRYIKKNEDYYVVANDFKAGFIAADYLAKNRFKKIIFINGFKGISTARDRCEGYVSALKENNINSDKNWIYNDIIDQKSGYNIIKESILPAYKKYFSILCYSDYIASGAIKYLTEKGIKIPEEVAVMGIDNTELLSFSYPGLSTVVIPKFVIGNKSAKLLFNIIKNPDYPKNPIILEPELKIRDSA